MSTGIGTQVRRTLILFASVAAMALLFASSALAAPKWDFVGVAGNPTAKVGDEFEIVAVARNVGDAPAPEAPGGDSQNCAESPPPGSDPSKCFRIEADLPAGLSASGVEAFGAGGFGAGEVSCTEAPSLVTCMFPGSGEGVAPLKGRVVMVIEATVENGASGALDTSFELSGAGGGTAESLSSITVTSDPPEFGIAKFDGLARSGPQGGHFTQAGAAPFAIETNFELFSAKDPNYVPGRQELNPIEPIKDVSADLPPGLLGNPGAVGQCTAGQLLGDEGASAIDPTSTCPLDSQVGTATVFLGREGASGNARFGPVPIFNMIPPTGSPARLGFNVLGTVVSIDAALRSDSDYGVTLASRNTSLALTIQGTKIEVWGVPNADPEHRDERACPGVKQPFVEGQTCPSNTDPLPFLRLPTACTPEGEGLTWTLKADSWEDPGDFKEASFESHDPPSYPFPVQPGTEQGPTGCEDVPVKGTLEAQTTSIDTETSSGLEVHVEVPNPGLQNPSGVSSSDLKRVKVSLPQGVTLNPSQASGLGVCSSAQYESSELSFNPDGTQGCPDDSKIGTVSVKTPLLEETLPGNVYVAKPFDNPFNSLLAIYIVIEEPQRGVLVKLPGEIRTNEQTGRIEAEFSDLPQVPFSSFDFKFREGARAPLVTPPTCGTYETVTEIEGHSDPGNTIESRSTFEIVRGIGGGPCPPNGTPAFKPGFSAGSINNNAGSFTPFNMRITRNDGEQDMTRFSAVLPPGVLGKLAGVGKCPNSAVAIAKSKTGLEERANPSCPANSEIGHSIVGAGVGSVLTYIPGKVYLGGAFNGNPLSVIAITPAVAGPFDVGTVVVQVALTLNPKTAEVEVDGSASDPIPHMLKGIPAKLRDLRVYVDRDKFILNPTSCDPSATDAELFGGGGNAFTSADDVPVFLQDRFQAANCAALGFKPKLGLKLKGGTKRGDFPGLQATYRPRPGDANLEGLVVRLPTSAFLEQGHIRTICTRVQFAADACPKASQYGYIKAWTPLIEEPLQGPVYLRSSNHKLPDLVFDLHGLVDVEVSTRIDSVRGGVRASVESAPDAPLSKVVVRMQGGKKGLIVNSRNLCISKNRANVESDGHNGKVWDLNSVMRPECGKARKGKRR